MVNPMNDALAIYLRNVTKTYKLYDKPIDRVKETFNPRRTKYHRPFNAINGLDLKVKQGESLGIIGRNGSGKSTLLQIICGIIQPTLGEIQVNGRVSALLELGAGFNPEFTGAQNIHIKSSILGLKPEQIKKKLDAIVAFADIGDFVHQPVKTYSSGMYVRLAFAVAVHVNPEILIVDEVLSVGDIFFQQKCNQHMTEMMQHCTRVIVSHDLQSIVNLCDSVMVMDKGRITFQGPPLKAIEFYTKLLHNEQFQMPEAEQPEMQVEMKPAAVKDFLNDPEWVDVRPGSIAGAGEIRIQKVKISNKDNIPIQVAKADDDILLQFIILVTTPKKNVIFGYTVKDRVGNAVCGMNTCDYEGGLFELEIGYYHIQLGFKWPEVFPEGYTITAGVGEGTHPMEHIIQCWAHNVVSITAISPGKAVHGLFNNPISTMKVSSIKF